MHVDLGVEYLIGDWLGAGVVGGLGVETPGLTENCTGAIYLSLEIYACLIMNCTNVSKYIPSD